MTGFRVVGKFSVSGFRVVEIQRWWFRVVEIQRWWFRVVGKFSAGGFRVVRSAALPVFRVVVKCGVSGF
jgi:hypothetical protein